MSIIAFIAIICIFIELWHIVFYTFLYKKHFKKADTVAGWAKLYENLDKYFMSFAQEYLNNQELQDALGLEKEYDEAMMGIIDLMKRCGHPTIAKHKILKICSLKQYGLFLAQQFIEIIYWFLIIALLFIMPDYQGTIPCFVLMLLSEVEKRCNKNKNWIWLNLDSAFCIGMFMIIARFY